MSPEIEKDTVGVIVARFQVPELHEGHRYIIDYVLERHEKVLVILGCSQIMTDRNPLSFEMRREMLESSYSGRCTIIASDSLPSSYDERSRRIDKAIQDTFPGYGAIIYGSRDSFVHTYTGIFETHDVPTVFSGSATEIRKNIGAIDSSDFRSGVIYSAQKQVGARPAIDVSIIRHNLRQVLLVGKNTEEGKLRFPGVFFDIERDDSYESSAMRCIKKEAPGIITGIPKIVRSCLIDDWRFRKTKHKVLSLITLAYYSSGDPCVGKGVDSVQWVPFEAVKDLLIPEHVPLYRIVEKFWH